MAPKHMPRRDFLASCLAGVPVVALDWESFPRGKQDAASKGSGPAYDAVIIGAGLGGLSCGAAFVRQGFRPLVIEKHFKPGGYATTFGRPGGFVFDASLHSTTVGERDGVYDLLPGFPEIKGLEFRPAQDPLPGHLSRARHPGPLPRRARLRPQALATCSPRRRRASRASSPTCRASPRTSAGIRRPGARST